MAGKSGREISATPDGGIKSKLLSWEGALVLILIGVNILGVAISPNYNVNNVLREMPRYLAEIFMMFGMGYILVLGDIDISVGALACLQCGRSVHPGSHDLPWHRSFRRNAEWFYCDTLYRTSYHDRDSGDTDNIQRDSRGAF